MENSVKKAHVVVVVVGTLLGREPELEREVISVFDHVQLVVELRQEHVHILDLVPALKLGEIADGQLQLLTGRPDLGQLRGFGGAGSDEALYEQEVRAGLVVDAAIGENILDVELHDL